MGFLTWLNDIVQALLQFVPRLVIVRATHGGVKWRWGRYVKEMKPGWHWYWPLTTDVEVIVTARQTYNTHPQALMTSDMKQVVVGGVIIYKIPDIVQAIGERNWDVDTTINDIAQAAIVEVVTKWKLDDLLHEISGKVEADLTDACKKQLRQFGVSVRRAALNNFSVCRSLNILGISRPAASSTSIIE